MSVGGLLFVFALVAFRYALHHVYPEHKGRVDIIMFSTLGALWLVSYLATRWLEAFVRKHGGKTESETERQDEVTPPTRRRPGILLTAAAGVSFVLLVTCTLLWLASYSRSVEFSWSGGPVSIDKGGVYWMTRQPRGEVAGNQRSWIRIRPSVPDNAYEDAAANVRPDRWKPLRWFNVSPQARLYVLAAWVPPFGFALLPIRWLLTRRRRA